MLQLIVLNVRVKTVFITLMYHTNIQFKLLSNLLSY